MWPVVYLDAHATTPVDPEVLDAMLPFFSLKFGNASSRTHRYGLEAEEAVLWARKKVALLIDCEPDEIFFTSGATESNNLALLGFLQNFDLKKSAVLSSAIEHTSVLDPLKVLEKKGLKLDLIGIDKNGILRLDLLEKNLTDQTVLISVMFANNEIGTLQPLQTISELACRKGAILFSDAAQAIGKIEVSVQKLGVDLLSLSAHKFYGPKGVGALFVRKRLPRIRLTPLVYGGGHEGGLRSGTLNVAGIVGLGKAAELAKKRLDDEVLRVRSLRERFYKKLSTAISDVRLNGSSTERLPNNLHLSFLGIDASRLLLEMKGVAASTGSACASALPRPSHVLEALGLSVEEIRGAVRFGFHRFNTEDEIDQAANEVILTVSKLKEEK